MLFVRLDNWVIDRVCQPMLDKEFTKAQKYTPEQRSQLPSATPFTMAQFMLAGAIAFVLVELGLILLYGGSPIGVLIFAAVIFPYVKTYQGLSTATPVPLTEDNAVRDTQRAWRIMSVLLTLMALFTLLFSSGSSILLLPLCCQFICQTYAYYFMACRQPVITTKQDDMPSSPDDFGPLSPS